MKTPNTIDDLNPRHDNPRTIKPKSKRGLKRSLEKFGNISGITFNVRTERLVCGHQRVAQLKALGGKYRDGAIWVDENEYPVRIVDWDEQTELEANIEANNQEIQGEWSKGIDEFLRELKVAMPSEDFAGLAFDSLAETLRIDFAIEDPGLPNLNTDDDENFGTMTFVLAKSQIDIVKNALELARRRGADTNPDNRNVNGNRLAMICSEFCDG